MTSSNAYLPPGVPGKCWRRSDRRVPAQAARRIDELIGFQVISGRMRYLIDDRVLSLGPGSLLWAHADQTHMLLSESADFDMWVVVVAPALLTPPDMFPPVLSSGLEQPGGARLLPADEAAALGAIARDLRRAEDLTFRAIGLRWWAARAWLAWRSAERMAGNPIHPAVQRAAELLRRDPDRSIAALAAQAGLSRSHLSRLFTRATGQSLAAFRTQMKLERVDTAMAATDAPPLLTAALDAGFGSYAQFFRAFRAVRKTGPRAYYR